MRRLLSALLLAAVPAAQAAGPRFIVRDAPSPLVTVKVMVLAGSALDPEGLEGLANLTAQALVQGGFGDPASPTTKERLAEITRPWGSRAYPSVVISKEAAVFSFTFPREAADRYLAEVLEPMLLRPIFKPQELERMRGEALQGLTSRLRFEQIEALGLAALDAFIYEGTPYAHPAAGTERGLARIASRDLRAFYETNYRPERMTVAMSSSDPELAASLADALKSGPPEPVRPLPAPENTAPGNVYGRHLLVVTMPNAISTGLHIGFPIDVVRGDPDYWPLYAANIWLGAHRDGFGHLYQVIREKRGYNYGDYSYIEHFEGRPDFLFPPPNAPRRHSYFSIWIRPVAHAFAPHVLRAVVWELEAFVRDGLSEAQCAAAKDKARVLYLSLAETSDRLLAGRLDDEFYGLDPGYLEGYLDSIDGVTCDRINAAIGAHLQWRDLKIVAVTDDDAADALVAGVLSKEPQWGKPPEAYQIDVSTATGSKIYTIPAEKLDLLGMDAVYAHERLDIPPARVRVVPSERLFRTAEIR